MQGSCASCKCTTLLSFASYSAAGKHLLGRPSQSPSLSAMAPSKSPCLCADDLVTWVARL